MHLEILTLVARIDAVKRLTIRFGHALAVENLGGRTGQLGKRGGDFRPGFEAGRRDPGLRQVEAQIGMKDAAGAQGAAGTMTRGMPSSRATSPACSGPAPP